MDVMKKHTGQIILSIFIAIIGVVCGVLPYFAVANIVTEIANGSTGFMVFSKQIMIILFGLVGSVLFHTLSTLISHNLAFCVIEDSRKKLARKFSKLPMGTIEKKGSGEWTQFMSCQSHNITIRLVIFNANDGWIRRKIKTLSRSI